jgi:hypothetical protein
MKVRSFAFSIIGFLGAFLFAFAVFSYVNRTPQKKEESTLQPEPSRTLFITMDKWSHSFWDKQQAELSLHRPADSQHPDHVYMSNVGSISYNVAVGPSLLDSKEAHVTAKLSSELPNTTSDDLAFSTDITLLVNGQDQGTKNVLPDNGFGYIYSWSVSPRAFKGGEINEITFMVRNNAYYKRGLCIYGSIQVAF